MIDLAILSSAYLHSICPDEVREEFREFATTLSRQRASLNPFTQEFREIEFDFAIKVIKRRIELFHMDAATKGPGLVPPSTFLFRLDETGGERLLEKETAGFFDEYDTPPPAYWVDFRIFRRISYKHFPEAGQSILTSWIPQPLSDRFRDVTRLSITGTLIWLDEILADPKSFFPELIQIASDLNERLVHLREVR